MPLYLAPHLHAAAFGRDLVLLDIVKGDYSLLAGASDVFSFTGPSRILDTEESDVGADLLAEGIVATAPGPLQKPPPRFPGRSALEREAEPVRPSDVTQMTLAFGAMVGRYWGKGLPALLEHARRGAAAAPASPLPIEEVARTALVFDQLSPWIPFQGDCLFRCFMLLQWLHRSEASGVRWVFGIRTGPFYAHCWLQADDLALTDFAEPLVNFSPVYAV